jgi:iron complex outermembrane receptor protein
LTVGGGWEFAVTPETGEYQQRATNDAAVAHLDLARALAERAHVHATISRRSRFPSMREMYSGALGRFVPNPELRPERQDLFEVGVSSEATRWDWGIAVFAAFLDDGIERVALPDGNPALFTRVNRVRIRTVGFEAVAGWRPWRSLSLTGHYTRLEARGWEDGAYQLPAEDRPEYLGTITCRYDLDIGLGGAVEWHVVGPRYGADPTVVGGLRHLPAQNRWDLRFSYTTYAPTGWLAGAQLFLRLDNVFDQVIEQQIGLPEPGRTISAGVKLRWGT